MKFVIIAVNCLLALWLIGAVVQNLARKGTAEPVYTVKKTASNRKASFRQKTVPAAMLNAAATTDSLLATVADNNLFNRDRCPNSQTSGGRSARVELSLVGTFAIGDCKGAIILQKTSTSNRTPFMMGMWGPTGGDMQMFGGNAQNSQNGGNTQNSRNGGSTARSGRSGRNSGGYGNAQSSGTNNSAAAVSVKQYIRVGETLSNGYKLAEVSRAKAVLTRGGDKMELELQNASKNQPQTAAVSRAATGRGAGLLQGLQQMQQMQMFQNMQMMRMMQRSMQNQNGGNNSNNRNSNRNNSSSSGNFGGPPGGGFGGPPGM